MRKKHIGLFLVFLIALQPLFAQQNIPFWKEIQAFKKEDSLHQQPKNAILFVGSSSFRIWKDVQQAFPKHIIINRGFGGSTLPDVIRYTNDIIIPYKPKQIVIYCGDNDLASSDTVSAELVFQRFDSLFHLIRTALPKASVVFVSIKPSPSRWQLKEKMITANQLIHDFLQTEKNTAFVDVWSPMLTTEGNPREELFQADRLHMKPEGYAIWQKAIEPYLAKTKKPTKD